MLHLRNYTRHIIYHIFSNINLNTFSNYMRMNSELASIKQFAFCHYESQRTSKKETKSSLNQANVDLHNLKTGNTGTTSDMEFDSISEIENREFHLFTYKSGKMRPTPHLGRNFSLESKSFSDFFTKCMTKQTTMS